MFIRPFTTGIPIVTLMRPSLEVNAPVGIDLETAIGVDVRVDEE